MVKQGENDLLTQRIIGCAIEVRRTLGPGLLESAHEQCMTHEMTLQDVVFRRQRQHLDKYGTAWRTALDSPMPRIPRIIRIRR